MATYIALFRGINVGGHNKLPMKPLVDHLQKLDFQNIQTYIQSGNLVFDSQETKISWLSEKISGVVSQHFGFTPQLIILQATDFQSAIHSNPFPEAEDAPKTLHVYFLEQIPKAPDFTRLDEVKQNSERYSLTSKVFYLHAPDGIGRSKLAQNVEKALGVAATARNWRTVSKIGELLQDRLTQS